MSLRRTQLRSNRSHRVSGVTMGRNVKSNASRRGSRGRGRRQPFNPRSWPFLSRVVDKRQINSGNYTPDEYQRLTPAQREAVKALQRQAREGVNNNSVQRDERRAGISSVTLSASVATNDGDNNQNDQSEASTGRESGVSSVTAPSGSVGSYLGSRRKHRNPPSSLAWLPTREILTDTNFNLENIKRIIRKCTETTIYFFSQISRVIYYTIQYVCTDRKSDTLNTKYGIYATVTNSRLAFSTDNVRKICKYTSTHDQRYSILGLDTHADISCVGRDAHILAQIERKTCSVHPFNDSYKPMSGLNIVDVSYKYENCDGKQYILEVNQCLDFSET